MSEQKPRDEVTELLPAEQTQRQLTCWYCGSKDLTRGLPLGLRYSGEEVGLAFTFRGTGYVPLAVTLCDECGTVVRLHIKETTRKQG
jgi:hypothetical protein